MQPNHPAAPFPFAAVVFLWTGQQTSTYLKDVRRSLSSPRARHSRAAVAQASVMTTTHGAGDLPLTEAMEGICTCDSTSLHTSADACHVRSTAQRPEVSYSPKHGLFVEVKDNRLSNDLYGACDCRAQGQQAACISNSSADQPTLVLPAFAHQGTACVHEGVDIRSDVPCCRLPRHQ